MAFVTTLVTIPSPTQLDHNAYTYIMTVNRGDGHSLKICRHTPSTSIALQFCECVCVARTDIHLHLDGDCLIICWIDACNI
jgi:hypothetical protein